MRKPLSFLIIISEEVVVESPNPSKLKKGPPAATVERRRVVGVEVIVRIGVDLEAGEESLERRIAIDEGGEDVSTGLDGGSEEEDEEREGEESE